MKRLTKMWLLGGVTLVGVVMPWQVRANDSSVGEPGAAVERARAAERASKQGEAVEPRTLDKPAAKAVETPAEKPADKAPEKSVDKSAENWIDKMFEGGPGNDRLTKMHAAHDDLLAVLRSDGHYAQFVQLAESSGFDKTLHGRGPYTVFAPTDEAFAKLSSDLRETLGKEPSRARALLTLHVIRGLVSKEVLNHLRNMRTMGGSIVNIDYTSGIRVNRAHLTSGDHYGTNGMFHAVDEVLALPERPIAAAKPGEPSRKKPNRKPAHTS